MIDILLLKKKFHYAKRQCFIILRMFFGALIPNHLDYRISNIESAMSDCLLIYPKGFENKILTQHFVHLDYNNINEITFR